MTLRPHGNTVALAHRTRLLAAPIIPAELARKRNAATPVVTTLHPVRRPRSLALPVTASMLALGAALAVFLAGAIAATPAGLIAGTLLILGGSAATWKRNR